MDPAAPPPWRVFDAPNVVAPSPTSDAGGRPVARAGAGSSPGRSTDELLSRLQANPLALATAAVLAIGGFALAALLAIGGVDGGVAVDGGAGLGSPSGSAGGARGELVVDVAGAVLRPGVYHLPAGARIGDAIAAAGGYSPRVAAEQASLRLNLAAALHDGDQVVVPSRDDPAVGGSSDPGGTTGGGTGGGHLIDLNHASGDELDSLPGVGPVTAAKVIAAREATPFGSVDELLERRIVSQKVFDTLKPLVTVSP